MVIYWAGGEDIDFLTLGSSGTNTTAGYFRSGWARCAIAVAPSGANAKSYPFPGGALTSAWLSFHCYINASLSALNNAIVGFGLSGTNSFVGLGTTSASASRVSLVTYNGSSVTVLASEAGNSWGTAGVSTKFDMQLTSYGATSTVNVYANGNLIISFSGSTAIAGMADFDSVFLGSGFTTNGCELSEFIVADSDTRAIMGLNTLALTGAGTTDAWSNNTYTNINGINYSDASPAYSNTNGQDQEYAVGTAQPAVFSVVAVVQSARMAASSGSTPTHVKLGYGSGGTGYFGTGAQKTPTVAFTGYNQIDAINPITGVAWTQADITAPLQLDIQSA